jgi:Domain of unknown function (DUF4402)
MRRKIRAVATTIVLLAMGPPRAAVAVIALEVTTQSTLSFGQFMTTTTSGTVTVSPSGSRTRSGGVALGNDFGVAAASFLITGEPNTAYSISLPSSCTLSADGKSLTADDFTSSPSGMGILGPGGTQSVTLGATLHVGIRQSAAAYSGSYAVTFSYD